VRLLLVEDERVLAETVRRGLADEGHVVTVAHDGREGLWLATHDEFDVVILDLMLPGMSGYRVLERMRAARVWTPVLVLTAKDGEYDEADAFDLGADDYLTKPFSFVVLLARLRALLRRGAPDRPTLLTAGVVELDPARHLVTVAGTPVDLTPREFRVLEYLLRHPGQVLTKTEIVRAVWDQHHEGDLNVVEVYVGYLRRKIDTRFGMNLIDTVRGVGYRLVDARPAGSTTAAGPVPHEQGADHAAQRP
jgi:two-component system OmpR family response regulator